MTRILAAILLAIVLPGWTLGFFCNRRASR